MNDAGDRLVGRVLVEGQLGAFEIEQRVVDGGQRLRIAGRRVQANRVAPGIGLEARGLRLDVLDAHQHADPLASRLVARELREGDDHGLRDGVFEAQLERAAHDLGQRLAGLGVLGVGAVEGAGRGAFELVVGTPDVDHVTGRDAQRGRTEARIEERDPAVGRRGAAHGQVLRVEVASAGAVRGLVEHVDGDHGHAGDVDHGAVGRMVGGAVVHLVEALASTEDVAAGRRHKAQVARFTVAASEGEDAEAEGEGFRDGRHERVAEALNQEPAPGNHWRSNRRISGGEAPLHRPAPRAGCGSCASWSRRS